VSGAVNHGASHDERRFVTTLRTAPTGLRLVRDDAGTVWTIRVQCAEAWDTVRVEIAPETLVREIKQAALSALMPDVVDRDAYVVKLNGFEVHDEGATVRQSGALDGSTFLLMARRRRPVR
jgi:hypothetical protein